MRPCDNSPEEFAGDRALQQPGALDEPPESGTRAAAKNVLFEDLPYEYKVYPFYYPAEMPDTILEDKLRRLGQTTGENLFINIGRLNDPLLGTIIKHCGITNYPVIVITAVNHSLHLPMHARRHTSDLTGEPFSATLSIS